MCFSGICLYFPDIFFIHPPKRFYFGIRGFLTDEIFPCTSLGFLILNLALEVLKFEKKFL